jgi:endonuclease/exonuclease/phosphatase family metal-dependent hydrolase
MSEFKQAGLGFKPKGIIAVFALLSISALTSHLRFISQSPVLAPHTHHNARRCPVQDGDIVAISYNIRMLPPLISSASPEHNMGRTAAIADRLMKLSPRPDIIFFQEAWSPRVREQLKIWLGEYYPYSTDTGPEDNERSLRRAVGAGLMVMSRFPIVDRQFQRFGVSSWTSADFFADKGALRVGLDIDGQRIDAVNLHLQAGDYPAVRAEQLEVVRRVAQGAHLLVGDFNFYGREHLDFLVNFSDYYDAHVDSQITSSDVWQGTNPRLLDYAFSSKKILGTCAQVLRGIYLSDHSPILFRLTPGLELE